MISSPGESPDWPATIGVALPIPEPFLGELGAYRERFGDPLAHAIVAHITLVPPMTVSDRFHLQAVIAHLAAVVDHLAPFGVQLSGSASFRPTSPVVYVPLTQGADRVCEIESLVRCGPLERALTFEYHPHVTVAQAVSDQWLDEAEVALADYRAGFDVTSIGLFRKGVDGVWVQEAEFPFRVSV